MSVDMSKDPAAPEVPGDGEAPEDAGVGTDRALLSVRDLHVGFDTDDGLVRAVDGINFDIDKGEVFAVVGESGSGKSVTSLSLLGLVPLPGKVEGQVLWKGRDLLSLSPPELRSIRGREISMIFQDPMTSLNPTHTVGRQIGEVVRVHEGASRKAARQRAIEVLGLVGIARPEQRVDAYPHELSGGQRQRAMIAMAIALEPDLLIADEPTTALDVTVQAQVLDLLLSIIERIDSAIMLITHDLGVVAGTADRVMVMYAGKTAETGTVDDIFYRSHHPYTVGLLSSLPRLDDDRAPLLPIPGQPPSLLNRPTGCPFHPRCPHARLPEPCATEEPELRTVAEVDAESGDGDVAVAVTAYASEGAAIAAHHAACHFASEVAPEAGVGAVL
jgi:oligopeptide/dipeptide ABC transporter ATP-binding protein